MTADPGNYLVGVGKVPLNISADDTLATCVGTTCELTFTSASQATPWFPWDVDGWWNWLRIGARRHRRLPNDILGVAPLLLFNVPYGVWVSRLAALGS